MSSYSPNPTAAAQPAVTVRRSRRRIGILALLAIGTMINYLDRTVLGIAAPKLTAELGIDPAIMGILFSAFAWTYALAQIPGGLFLDRFGNKVTYFLSLTLWSLFTLFHGMAVGLKTLLLCRFGLGISEAPCFPVNSRVVSAWFPQQERAKATAVYTVGEYLGLACFAPLLFWIMDGFGWRVLFVSVGAVGILFALVWWRCYREPHEDPRLSQQEREHIENGGGLSAPTDQQVAFSWPLVRQLLSKRQIIGASIGQFAGNTVLVFFLTWFPTWLATERHMPWLKVGFFSILPFVAAAGGVMFGGWLSDKLFKGRRMPLAIICMTLIFICLIGYWKSESLLMVTVFAAIVGCLIYVPQFLASVQTMEIVPSCAVGSAVGLRGFMSYIFGASLGTSLFGVMVDKMGWHGGFYLLMGGIVCCILFCYLSHRGALELEQQRKITEQEEARLALADAQ